AKSDDDETALKWAAIEKLPTFDRLKTGLLMGSDGDTDEVNVKSLGFQQRNDLIQRVVEEDNEKFLMKLKNRIEKVGIEIPKTEVRFENLRVETEAYVGNRALPSFFNFFTNLLEGFTNHIHIFPNKKKPLTILDDISGILKPGRMTLLLGPPSSGKTTLLLALAGLLDPNLKFSGVVTYNGYAMKEFIPQRTAAYISQNDIHMRELTVRETLAFSARCQGVGTNHEILANLSRKEKEMNIKPDPDLDLYMKAAVVEGQEETIITDYIIKILGLETCADTLIGDEMIRGISGGQKKRVTIGEVLVGPAKTLFMDEISNGLDSSTTHRVVNFIKQSVHILEGTVLVALLQPEPETFDLFDDVILVSEGLVVYQGPRECALEFFLRMGFKCPQRKGVADFLQEVTSKKDQKQYWADGEKPYRFITVKEFSEEFKKFHAGEKLITDLSIPFRKSPNYPPTLTTKRYGVRKRELLKACATREILLVKRNSFFYIFKLFQLCMLAVIAMTAFLRTNLHKNNPSDGRLYANALVNGVISCTFNGLAQVPLTIQKLPVFFKQRNYLFFPAWAYAIPGWIVEIPISVVEIVFFTLLTYYEIGFDPNIGRFFKYFLVLLLLSQAAASLFRLIGVTSRIMVIANTFGFFVLLMIFALSGFFLSREQVKKWWLWGYYISPMMYAQNAILVNEFRGHSWSQGFENSNTSLGVDVLKSIGYYTKTEWYWIGVGALLAIILILNTCIVLAFTYLQPFKKTQAVMPEDNARKEEELVENTGQKKMKKHTQVVLPFAPHSLTFDEVKYAVDMPQELKAQGVTDDKLVLIKSVSGAFRPGVLTALMGVSGAGKTTLMDVLAGRKTSGYVEGNITVSGYPKIHATFARISGYCEQTDIHSPCLTVYESMLFSAWLRLPQEVNVETRKAFIENVMELIELTTLKKALVGMTGVNGLSTEQRKRLTIAVELVANPSVIFMDEPTSGLDARAAAIVMRVVRNTVDTGRTIVCTIHQPSIDIFEAFDELLLLKRGGQEIYNGPLGHHSCNLIRYLEGIGGVAKIRDGCNPATWMLEVTSPSQELVLGVDFSDIYRNSELYRRNKSLVAELSTPRSSGSSDLRFDTKFSQPFYVQCIACLWKQYWSYWRNPLYSAARILYTFFLALIFGSMFWNLGSKKYTEQDIFNAMGSMYGSVFFLGVQLASSVQPVVSVERTVFYREKAAGLYSALPYAFAQIVIEIPYCLAQGIIFGTIVYAMIGFDWTPAKYFWYIFFMFSTLLYFTFYGMMMVAVTPNELVANVISSSFYGWWNLFSGFIIPRPKTPVWWRWFHWVNPVAWSLYGLVSSQFGDVSARMETGESVEDFVESYFGFHHDLLGVVAVVIIGLVVGFGFVFAFSIKAFNFQKR
ncbi:hypothetical protein M569_03105, partial [Genlisea aurea]